MILRFFRQHFGILLLLIGAGVSTAAPLGIGNDGIVRYHSLVALLRDGKLDSTKYSHYGPLVASPLWYLGEAIGYPDETVWTFNRIVFLAMTVGLWLTLRPILPQTERVRFLAFLFFGSQFPWHLMGFFGEVFCVACVGLGFALLVIHRGGWAILGGLLCVWGTANVPASSVGLALGTCVLCWHRRRFRYLLLTVIAAALILLENELRRGDPLKGGYAGEAGYPTVMPFSGLPDFSYPFFFGVLSVLFSFGKGLVFFTPGLFARYPEDVGKDENQTARGGLVVDVSPPRDDRLLYDVWLAIVVGLVLVYARWWAWYGGAVWGPRFFLFASLPASLVLTRWTMRAAEYSTWANVLVLIAVTLSCWVGVNGLVYQGHGSDQFWVDNFSLEYLTWYVPECSVLWMPFVYPKALDWEDYARLGVFGLGFAYLAWPVICVLFVRFRRGCVNTWYTIRSGPRWRI